MSQRKKNTPRKIKEPTVKTVPEVKGKKKLDKKPTVSQEGASEKQRAKPVGLSPRKRTEKAKPPLKTEQNAETDVRAEKAETPETAEPVRKIKVMFVCTGNTCRSPMAQYLFEDYLKGIGKSDMYEVASGGLAAFNGERINYHAAVALERYGLNGDGHRAKMFTFGQYISCNFVICMTDAIKNRTGTSANILSMSQIIGRDVPDPYGGTEQDYIQTAAVLHAACPAIYAKITESIH
ncbi:MAG: hypothetical protein HFE48_00155 [Clostridia bacterium]|nr:hypothetical protein [Clostridia bacterium]